MSKVRGWLVAAVMVAAVAGCSSSGGTPTTSSPPSGAAGFGAVDAGPSAAPSAAPPAPSRAASSAPPPAPAVPALTCAQLRHAYVGSATVSYNGYHDSIPLGDGRWSGADGATVTLQPPCGIGDLNGDGAKDAVGVVALTTGGTGNFYTLVVWRNAAGVADFVALADLGDRNPVQSIAISGQKATVVYLTRTDGSPMAVANVKRTAVYRLAGSHFTEVSRSDVPFSG